GAVAAEHNLFLCVVERIERVKELRLRPFLAGHELNVVHEQNVNRSVSLTKIENAVITNGVDHLVHEPLGRNVSQFERAIVLEPNLSDGRHRGGLSTTT